MTSGKLVGDDGEYLIMMIKVGTGGTVLILSNPLMMHVLVVVRDLWRIRRK